jgi:hypothetical protein
MSKYEAIIIWAISKNKTEAEIIKHIFSAYGFEDTGDNICENFKKNIIEDIQLVKINQQF